MKKGLQKLPGQRAHGDSSSILSPPFKSAVLIKNRKKGGNHERVS